MRVLIVDDQRSVALAIAAAIERSHHEVAGVVGSGLEAIRAYRREKPDVVLMDDQMPGLNGVTACRHITSSDASARVILLAAGNGKGGVSTIACGAVATLSKPFQIEEFEQLLDRLDEEALQRLAGSRAAASANPFAQRVREMQRASESDLATAASSKKRVTRMPKRGLERVAA